MKHNDEWRYQEALKQVKKVKGFYIHLIVFVIANLMILLAHYQEEEPLELFFQFETFSTLFFWGFGLLAHGLSVFLPPLLLGKGWEERKIRELMEKNQGSKQQ